MEQEDRTWRELCNKLDLNPDEITYQWVTQTEGGSSASRKLFFYYRNEEREPVWDPTKNQPLQLTEAEVRSHVGQAGLTGLARVESPVDSLFDEEDEPEMADDVSDRGESPVDPLFDEEDEGIDSLFGDGDAPPEKPDQVKTEPDAGDFFKALKPGQVLVHQPELDTLIETTFVPHTRITAFSLNAETGKLEEYALDLPEGGKEPIRVKGEQTYLTKYDCFLPIRNKEGKIHEDYRSDEDDYKCHENVEVLEVTLPKESRDLIKYLMQGQVWKGENWSDDDPPWEEYFQELEKELKAEMQAMRDGEEPPSSKHWRTVTLTEDQCETEEEKKALKNQYGVVPADYENQRIGRFIAIFAGDRFMRGTTKEKQYAATFGQDKLDSYAFDVQIPKAPKKSALSSTKAPTKTISWAPVDACHGRRATVKRGPNR